MLNSIIIMGRLTKDPELRTAQNGNNFCKFCVAVDRPDRAETRKTDFIDCVAFKETADFLCRYFRKGRMVAVVGSMQQRKWQDQNGNSRSSYEIKADRIEFCGDRKDSVEPAPVAVAAHEQAESYGQKRARQLAEEGKPAEPAPVSMEDLIDQQDLPF